MLSIIGSTPNVPHCARLPLVFHHSFPNKRYLGHYFTLSLIRSTPGGGGRGPGNPAPRLGDR